MIFMDTLALRTDKKPLKYSSKIFPLPHLRGVLCGTGSFNTIMDWFVYIQEQIVGNIIDIPNRIAPSRLKEIHSRYDLNGTNATTIYHFGFNPREEDSRIRGFAFRSINNFSMEELRYGIGIKPHNDDILKYFDAELNSSGGNSVDLMINLIKKQKDNDDKEHPTNRLGIGGSIHLFHLDKFHQFIWECYNFDDYDKTYAEITPSQLGWSWSSGLKMSSSPCECGGKCFTKFLYAPIGIRTRV